MSVLLAPLSFLWGSSLSDDERAERRRELYVELKLDPDTTRPESLDAFLIAREYDVQSAAEMWRVSANWRKQTFPITRTVGIERILQSGRFRDLGFNNEAPPRRVLMFDSQWGKFLDGEDGQELLLGYLVWWEEQLRLCDSQEAAYSVIYISIGGPPPMAWCQRLTKVLEGNYPERLHRAVIFPVPWLLRRVVNGMLWFLPRRTKDKFEIVSDIAGLISACNLNEDQLPTDIRETTVESLAEHVRHVPEATQQWQKNSDGDDYTARVCYIGAGKGEQLRVEINDCPEWFRWTCEVDQGYDVGLQVAWEQEDKAEPVVLSDQGRFTDLMHGERFVPSAPGNLVFYFDNSYSWITGKNACAEIVVHREHLQTELDQ